MRLLNLRINFYLLRTFCPHLGRFFCVLFLLSQRFGQISPLALFRWFLPRPRIGMMNLVTVFPVITAFHSCCLSHHVFDQVNLWPASRWALSEDSSFRSDLSRPEVYCCFRYEQFINFWLRFFDTRRENQFLKVLANPILSDPNAQRILWCLRSLSVEIRKTQLYLRRSKFNSQLTLFQNLPNSQEHLFRAWFHLHASPISCLGIYYDNGDCHILCARA